MMRLYPLVRRLEEEALNNKAEVVAEIMNKLTALTNRSEGMSPGNLYASVMLINELAVLRSGNKSNPSEKEIQSFVEATSNVLQPNNTGAWKELNNFNRTVATAILFSVDVYGRSLSTLNISDHRIEADNLILETWSLERSNLPRQLDFPSQSASDDKISIPLEALESRFATQGLQTLNVWGSYYRTINDYLPQDKNENEVIRSRILSFSIDGLKTEEALTRPVILTFRHTEAESVRFRRKCSFWNFHRSDWDSTGCSVTSTNSTHTICSCHHLSNFAVMMSLYPSYDKVLSNISLIGCSISVVALILTVFIYAATWKQSKSTQATVLLNLCVALIIAYIVFMAGADKVDDKLYSKVGCKTVAVLLHYFFLAAFFIMLAEGVELLLYIIFVFHVRRTRETIMLIASAWALPLFIVVVSLISTNAEGYGDRHACWLSVANGLIWAFIGPVLFIVMVNLVILVIILRWMSRQRSYLAKNIEKRDEMRATIWNMAVTCPVLGLGWLFGVFSIAFDSVAFQYLFVIINSLQGLHVFIFHALLHNKKINEKISCVYSNFFGRWSKSDVSIATKVSSVQEQPAKQRDEPGVVSGTVRVLPEGEGRQENVYCSIGTQNASFDDSDSFETKL